MVSPTDCLPRPTAFSQNNAGRFACVMTPMLRDPAMPAVWMGRGVAPGRLFLCCIQERERMAAANPGAPPPAGGPGMGPGLAEGTDTLFVALSAGFTALSHPLVYVKLLMQVRRWIARRSRCWCREGGQGGDRTPVGRWGCAIGFGDISIGGERWSVETAVGAFGLWLRGQQLIGWQRARGKIKVLEEGETETAATSSNSLPTHLPGAEEEN